MPTWVIARFFYVQFFLSAPISVTLEATSTFPTVCGVSDVIITWFWGNFADALQF
jgi:hypothetical protein